MGGVGEAMHDDAGPLTTRNATLLNALIDEPHSEDTGLI